MRAPSARTVVAPVVLALALGATGCSQATEEPSATIEEFPASMPGRADPATPTPELRSGSEQAFLNDLAEFGLPAGMSADTTVEVGLGICENIAGGAGTDVILTHIRPLSSAIASQSTEHDSDRVGRAIVEASRTHLCD